MLQIKEFAQRFMQAGDLENRISELIEGRLEKPESKEYVLFGSSANPPEALKDEVRRLQLCTSMKALFENFGIALVYDETADVSNLYKSNWQMLVSPKDPHMSARRFSASLGEVVEMISDATGNLGLFENVYNPTEGLKFLYSMDPKVLDLKRRLSDRVRYIDDNVHQNRYTLLRS